MRRREKAGESERKTREDKGSARRPVWGRSESEVTKGCTRSERIPVNVLVAPGWKPFGRYLNVCNSSCDYPICEAIGRISFWGGPRLIQCNSDLHLWNPVFISLAQRFKNQLEFCSLLPSFLLIHVWPWKKPFQQDSLVFVWDKFPLGWVEYSSHQRREDI